VINDVLKLMKNADFYTKSGSYPGKDEEAAKVGAEILALITGARDGLPAEEIAEALRSDNKGAHKPPDAPMSPTYVGRVLARPSCPFRVVRG
jgi:hypothetical protein